MPICLAATAFAATAKIAAADGTAVYSSLSGTPTSYLSFYGTDPNDTFAAGSGNGNGDDYNAGPTQFQLTGFSFYGGDTDPNQTSNPAYVSPIPGLPNADQYGVNLEFYDLSGNRVATIGLSNSKVYGIGLHTLSASDLTQGGASVTIPGAGYFSFEPGYLTYHKISQNPDGSYSDTVTPPPPGRPQFTLGYGTAAPTIGVNNPTISAKTNAAVSSFPQTFVTTGAYGAGGDPTMQYGKFEVDGTNPSTTVSGYGIWAATGSGNWGTATNWNTGVPNSSSSLSSANFASGITSNATVSLVNTDKTAANINFQNSTYSYTIAGPHILTLSSIVPSGDHIGGVNATASGTVIPATINSWAGSHALTCPIVYTAGLNVTTFANPSSSSPSLTLPLSVSATGTLTKSGAGTLSFAPSSSGIVTLNLPALNITAGTVALQSNSIHINRTLLTTASLTLASGTTLDLGNNDLDDSADTFATIYPSVVTGFAHGAWNGPGIASAGAASNTGYLTALAVIQNNQSGTPLFTVAHQFDGITPGVSDILVKYTYYGDADLNGVVNGADYQQIDQGFGSGATGWLNGDFNYDGVVNGTDFALIDNVVNQIAATNAGSLAMIAGSTNLIAAPAALTTVPEPTTLGWLGIGIVGLLCKRKRLRRDM